VEYCFDKPLVTGTTLTAGNFTLTGYRSNNTITSVAIVGFPKVDQTNNQCVIAVFPTAALSDVDLTQFTVAGVAAGAVSAQTSLAPNDADNTTLTTSTTHNGTTGLTVGPDLTGVVTDVNSNTITYVEDQNVAPGSIVPADFYFSDAAGHTCTGTGLVGTGLVANNNSVTVTFSAAAGCGPVTDAVRAGQTIGAVTAAADTGAKNTDDNVIVPGQTGLTAGPNLLTTTTLEANGSAIDYTFDQPVTVVNPANFRATLSNGSEIAGTSATISGNTVRVSFTFGGISLSEIDEYVVKADVLAGAVTGVNPPNPPNVPATVPVGGNAGAFARGFTTGQDAFGASFASNGVVTVDMDQRGIAANAGGFILLDTNGNPIPGAATSVTFPTQAAGPQVVPAQFTPAQVAVAKGIEILGQPNSPGPFPVSTETLAISVPALGGAPAFGAAAFNVQQILSPTVTASKLSRPRYKSNVSRKAAAAKAAAQLAKWKAQDAALVRRHAKL
jgi:hypothetical protein